MSPTPRRRLAGIAVSALLLAPVAPLSAQTLVYDLPGDQGGVFTYFLIAQGTEYADSAVLGGTNRVLSEASVAVYSNVPRTATVTFSIYDTAAADFNFSPGSQVGQPGVAPGPMADLKPLETPLYTSGPVEFSFAGDGPIGNDLNTLVFSGINTLVPDEIFWSIQFEDVSNYTDGGAFGPKLENAANLLPGEAATDPSRLYARTPGVGDGAWLPTWLGSRAPPTSTLSLQLTAIPEPAAALLLALGGGLLLRRQR